MAVGMIVMFGCFGMTAAYFVFKKDQPIVMTIPSASPQGPGTPSPSAGPAAAGSASPFASAGAITLVFDAGTKSAPAAAHAPSTTGPAVAAAKPNASAVADPALRDLIASTGTGPAPGGGTTGGGTTARLTEDETRAVVTLHNLAVRRTCWDRNPSTAPSVNETVHIVIADNGQVTEASATGNDPVVGHCLEEEVRRWKWPAGGEVSVPFHFLRQ